MIVNYRLELEVALEAARKACELCREVQQARLSGGVIEKRDGSPVTVADYGSQAVVSTRLEAVFPKDPLVSEEDTGLLRLPENAALRQVVLANVNKIDPGLNNEQMLHAIDRGTAQANPKGRFWTLDPIDGTKGFLRGRQYAVALALIEKGEVVLGVLGCPSLPENLQKPHSTRGFLFFAVKGQGSWAYDLAGGNKTRIEVSCAKQSSDLRLCESFEPSHSSHKKSLMVAEYLGIKKPPIRMDSQCKYGIVARGEASVYLRLPTQRSYVEAIWDHAAGSILVREAGGKVTDLMGKELDFAAGRKLSRNRGIIASNGKLHERILEAVHRVAL